jgi:hypothetical protein
MIKLIGFADKAEADGSHTVLIEINGREEKLLIPKDHIIKLINAFQHSVIERAASEVQNVPLLQLSLFAVQTAHKGPECELMVSSHEFGAMAVQASDDLLRAMKIEIDKVLTFRKGSVARN